MVTLLWAIGYALNYWLLYYELLVMHWTIGYLQEPIQQEQAENYLATPFDPHYFHQTEPDSEAWLVG